MKKQRYAIRLSNRLKQNIYRKTYFTIKYFSSVPRMTKYIFIGRDDC